MTDSEIYKILCQKNCLDPFLFTEAHKFCKNIDVRALWDVFLCCDEHEILSDGTLFFKNAFYPYDFFTRARSIFSKDQILHETAFLYLYISLMPFSFELYKSLGIDENIFFDTMSTIFDTALIYKKQTGVYGTYDYLWLANHLRANVIRLGSFEYQNGIFSYSQTQTLTDGTIIQKGSRVLFLHVPYGTDFSKSARTYSYHQAFSFFDAKALICDSWLLFPENAKSLGENSNIADFYNDFKVFHIDFSRCYDDLFRIFGPRADYSDINSLPNSTRLQKTYIERLKSGKPHGSAVGIRTNQP